jgi:hypothetical protein
MHRAPFVIDPEIERLALVYVRAKQLAKEMQRQERAADEADRLARYYQQQRRDAPATAHDAVWCARISLIMAILFVLAPLVLWPALVSSAWIAMAPRALQMWRSALFWCGIHANQAAIISMAALPAAMLMGLLTYWNRYRADHYMALAAIPVEVLAAANDYNAV